MSWKVDLILWILLVSCIYDIEIKFEYLLTFYPSIFLSLVFLSHEPITSDTTSKWFKLTCRGIVYHKIIDLICIEVPYCYFDVYIIFLLEYYYYY